jgi:CheY-like chemotaxis protein
VSTPVPTRPILLVDDDADNRAIYATILRSHGYEVVEAETGGEAVALARQHLPMLVVMDIKMPQMDGWQALEILRESALTADLPIVALTIIAPGEDRRDPLRRGFDAHWVKPLTPGELLARVEAWLSDSRQEA